MECNLVDVVFDNDIRTQKPSDHNVVVKMMWPTIKQNLSTCLIYFVSTHFYVISNLMVFGHLRDNLRWNWWMVTIKNQRWQEVGLLDACHIILFVRNIEYSSGHRPPIILLCICRQHIILITSFEKTIAQIDESKDENSNITLLSNVCWFMWALTTGCHNLVQTHNIKIA